ncbi:MAG: hypothetical protein JXP34_04730 [Planctomycetes bacterium]|nr:hypothetical protein [Planctomycetota bacterium]
MSGSAFSDLPIADIRAGLERGDRQGVLAAAEGLRAARPDDARVALLLGLLQLEAENRAAAIPPLLAAARDPRCRRRALTALAACVDDARGGEILSAFAFSNDGALDDDAVRYAYGLALWRMGERGEALRTWSKLSEEARRDLEGPLARAQLFHASALLESGDMDACFEVVEPVAERKTAEALPVVRALVLACLHAGRHVLAARAAGMLSKSDDSYDDALRAAVLPSGSERARRFDGLASCLEDADLRGWARRVAAAENALLGRYDDAIRTLPEDSEDPDDAVMRMLLGAVSGSAEAPEPVERLPWDRLKEVAADAPILLRRLLPGPVPTDPLREAAYWLARSEPGRVHAVLAEAQRKAPSDARLARHLAAIAYIRAMRAVPSVDVEAWRDAIAQFTLLLENPLWLDGWIARRFDAYGAREDIRESAEDLRRELGRFLDRRLTQLLGAAQERGDRCAEERVKLLRAELAGERGAAATIVRMGGFPLPDGGAFGFGPLFTERADQGHVVWEYFAAHPPTSDERDRERLIELLRAVGLDEAGVRATLESGDVDVQADLRRWFSELREAASLHSEGRLAEAGEKALGVYVRWSPPDRPDEESFRRLNPAYAGIAGGVERIRRDASALICQMHMEDFERSIAAPGWDPHGTGDALRRILRESVALDQEQRTRFRLSQIVLGKWRSCLDDGRIPVLRRGSILLEEACLAGLEGLARARAIILARCGDRLGERKRWAEAAECYEEAWSQDESEPVIPVNLTLFLLQRRDGLLEDGRRDEAQRVLRRACEVAERARESFPGREEVSQLASLIMMAERGARMEELIAPEAGAPAETPAMPVEAVEILRRCQEARRRGDLEATVLLTDEARRAAPSHPDVAVLAGQAALELARAVSGERGRALLTQIDQLARDAGKRHPDHRGLRDLASLAARDRILHEGAGPLAELHRKALRLHLSGEHAEAASLLKVVFALSPTRDPEVVSLLAEALVTGAEGARGKAAAGDLTTARTLLALGREIDPEHRGMERTRKRLEGLLGDFGLSEDSG